MSSHVEYGRKRCAAQVTPASPYIWSNEWNREDGFMYSYYVRKDVFSGTSPKQIPQPTGKICRYRQKGLDG